MQARLISCLFLLLLTLACDRAQSTTHTRPDAVRDLMVDRFVWKPKAVAQQAGALTNEHKFSITNTSGQYSYRQIRVCFDYYDAQYKRIGTDCQTLAQQIEPRSMVAVSPIQIGKANPLATSATVRIEKADSE